MVSVWICRDGVLSRGNGSIFRLKKSVTDVYRKYECGVVEGSTEAIGSPDMQKNLRDQAVSAGHVGTSPNLATDLGGNAGKKFHGSNVIIPQWYPVGPDRQVLIPNLVD